ncbi:SpoIIE family protein phosphatase [Phycicoccus sp. Root101]|uniref:SpoIIE family protein phosphatase n=1 Tax=Phycicoccus sp. Root101 TaxID=1736421 RepID=UPI0012F9A52E|nr:SpoIIE family protein phosphatase [Phycicoccus sp. Root101]
MDARSDHVRAGQDLGGAVTGDSAEARQRAATDARVGAADTVRDVFDQLGVMVVAWEGPEHVAVAANAPYRHYVGREAFIGQPWSQVMPELEGQQFLEILDRVYSSGETHVGSEWRFQIRRDDTDQLHEIYVDFTVTPRRDADGRTIGAVCSVVDVTDRVHERHEAALRTAHEQERYEAVHDVVVELQRALLSMSLPVLPTATIAARYLVAAHDQAAGGDWFDAFVLDSGMLALVVGDVVGHGVAASAAMGQLRAVLEELLRTERELEAVLGRLDAYAAHNPTMRAATVVVVLLDPETGKVVYGRCGHPAPLVLAEDGTTRLLDAGAGGPLGTGAIQSLAHTTLARGEVVLLYSDGLVERTGHSLDDGVRELSKVASDAMVNRSLPVNAAASAADRVAELTMELMTRSGHEDDVTVLVAQRLARRVEDLDLRLTATRESLHQVNAAFGAWLAALGPSAADRFALELAVTEAVTNVIEHAYPVGRPGVLNLIASVLPTGGIAVRVGDEGRWQAPPSKAATGGRGLLLMSQVVDEAEVLHPPQSANAPEGDRGTTVVLRHRAHRDAVMASGRSLLHDETREGDFPEVDFEVVVDDCDEGPVVRLTGTVDLDTAERARAALLGAARGGVRSLTIDLTGVHQLASAGVRALFEVREQLLANRKQLVIVAEPGSPAAIVLELVSLAYHHPLTAPPTTA